MPRGVEHVVVRRAPNDLVALLGRNLLDLFGRHAGIDRVGFESGVREHQALAAMMQPEGTTALSRIVAPMPIRQLSPMMAPWTMALCPTETSLPMIVCEGCFAWS